MPSEKGPYTNVFLAALVVEDRRVRALGTPGGGVPSACFAPDMLFNICD